MQSAMIHHYCLFTLQMDSRGIWAVRSGARTLSASTIQFEPKYHQKMPYAYKTIQTPSKTQKKSH